MKKILSAALVLFGVGSAAFAASDVAKLDGRIAAAHAVLHELMDTPDKGIPLDVAAKAHCVAVIPSVKKGAFIVGAEYGQGVATCRTAKGWSAPVFIQLTGGSVGFQAGGQATDLVLIGVSNNSMDLLLHEKMKLGGDASASARAGWTEHPGIHHRISQRWLSYLFAEPGFVCRRRPQR